METMELGIKTVRALDTWGLIVKDKDVPDVLKHVHVASDGGTVSAVVTDRYRIVHAPINEVAAVSATFDTLIPVGLLKDFVAATKMLGDWNTVVFTKDDEGILHISASNGVTMSVPVPKSTYPTQIRKLIVEHEATVEPSATSAFNFDLYTDLLKVADPNVGILPPSRRNTIWHGVVSVGNVWKYTSDRSNVSMIIQSPRVR